MICHTAVLWGKGMGSEAQKGMRVFTPEIWWETEGRAYKQPPKPKTTLSSAHQVPNTMLRLFPIQIEPPTSLG